MEQEERPMRMACHTGHVLKKQSRKTEVRGKVLMSVEWWDEGQREEKGRERSLVVIQCRQPG